MSSDCVGIISVRRYFVCFNRVRSIERICAADMKTELAGCQFFFGSRISLLSARAPNGQMLPSLHIRYSAWEPTVRGSRHVGVVTETIAEDVARH